ncbi:hypothetical protein ACVWZ9_004041 [Pseudomonas chlororaphis]
MSVRDEMLDEFEVQDGVNCATVELLKIIAWTVAARLPAEHRGDFQEMLESIPSTFEPFREMPVNAQEAFSHVVNVVSEAVKELN